MSVLHRTADLMDMMREVVGMVDSHGTCEEGGEDDLEEAVVELNCSPASIQRPTNRIGNSYCKDSRLTYLGSDMIDCVGES